MKSEYPEVSIHLSNLKEAEKAYGQSRIEFKELEKTKALVKYAVLQILTPKQ